MTYRQKFNTFFPKWLWKLSPTRYTQLRHWESQKEGDLHGFNQYKEINNRKAAIVVGEIKLLVREYDTIFELGCNCGYLLNRLKKEGFTNLHGIEVSKPAIDYGIKKGYLNGVRVYEGSFEDFLPALSRNLGFEMVLSCGSTISAVHPSFDIIRYACRLSRKYVMLVDEFNNGFAYPRLWNYEFNKWGFGLSYHMAGNPVITIWRKK